MIQNYKIDTSIYNENIIIQAIEDFKEITRITFVNNQFEIIWESVEEIEEVFNELMNYIVSLINE